jgi:hypothetical protein
VLDLFQYMIDKLADLNNNNSRGDKYDGSCKIPKPSFKIVVPDAPRRGSA